MGASQPFYRKYLLHLSAPNKKIIDYKIYLSDLYDVILKGKCSECKTIVARYIETGEEKENYIVADRIKKSSS